jgi:hypothetical protein
MDDGGSRSHLDAKRNKGSNQMANCCSQHQGYVKDCPACNAHPWDILGVPKEHWDAKVAKAEAAGIHKCEHCGFEYYKTVDCCPLCSKYRTVEESGEKIPNEISPEV